MTTIDTLTDKQVEALLAEASAAGDAEMVSDCRHVLRAWARSVVYAEINGDCVERILAAINYAEGMAQ